MLELDSIRISHEIHEEHAADEAYRTEDPDRRKILYSIKTVLQQNLECHGIRKRYGRHVECHAESVQREKDTEFHIRTCC